VLVVLVVCHLMLEVRHTMPLVEVLDQVLFKVDLEDLVTCRVYHQVKEIMVVVVQTQLALTLVEEEVAVVLVTLVALVLTVVAEMAEMVELLQ
tara:strand:+ start:285 stop:563 length:279 start_codon:yes stop_codon:yes gene_type:complete